MITRIRLLCGAWFMLAAGQLLAADTGLDAIQQLPALVDARTLEQNSQLAVEKIYPLGSVRRISGQLRFSDELTVRGDRHYVTWQLSPVHMADAAFTQSREQLQEQGARLLYWCEGRDCGPSNLWANAVFGNARLYGPDDRQVYALLARHDAQELFALYAVTRGNGRNMLHVEQFNAEHLPEVLYPAAGTLLLQLRKDGRLQLDDGEGNARMAVAELARALNRDGSLRVAIGGMQAEHWREQLVNAGVRAARLELSDSDDAATFAEVLR